MYNKEEKQNEIILDSRQMSRVSMDNDEIFSMIGAVDTSLSREFEELVLDSNDDTR